MSYAPVGYQSPVRAAELDGNPGLDLVFSGGSLPDGGSGILTLLNGGDGGLLPGPAIPRSDAASAPFAPLPWPASSRSAFLALSWFGGDAGGAIVLRPLDDGGYDETVAWDGGPVSVMGSWTLNAADINGDGLADAFFICSDASTGSWALCVSIQGASGFAVPTAYDGPDSGSSAPDVSGPIDLNGDGLPDLVTLERRVPAGLYVWLNVDGGAFYSLPPVAMAYGSLPYGFAGEPEIPLAQAMAFADFRRDGTVGVAYVGATWPGQPSYAISVLANDGAGHLGLTATLPVPNPSALAVIDANCDGWPDLTNGTELFLNEHDGGFSSGTTVGTLVPWIFADLNGDGWPDPIGPAPYADVSLSR